MEVAGGVGEGKGSAESYGACRRGPVYYVQRSVGGLDSTDHCTPARRALHWRTHFTRLDLYPLQPSRATAPLQTRSVSPVLSISDRQLA